MNARYALGRTNRAAFSQKLQHANSLLLGQNHIAKRLLLRLNESGFAFGIQAAIALIAFSIFPMLLCWSVAALAVHFVFSYLSNTRLAFCLSIVNKIVLLRLIILGQAHSAPCWIVNASSPASVSYQTLS